MKKNSKNSYKEIEDFFSGAPTANQKAWGLINDFYHLVLSYMEENDMKPAQLAKKLGVSRSYISQMFNKTPNISVKKMVEIADAIGINIKFYSDEVVASKNRLTAEKQNTKVINYREINRNWMSISCEKKVWDSNIIPESNPAAASGTFYKSLVQEYETALYN